MCLKTHRSVLVISHKKEKQETIYQSKNSLKIIFDSFASSDIVNILCQKSSNFQLMYLNGRNCANHPEETPIFALKVMKIVNKGNFIDWSIIMFIH